MKQSSLFCVECDRRTLHSKPSLTFGMGCIVTLITGCFFLPFWLLIEFVNMFSPWRCQSCGLSYSGLNRKRRQVVREVDRQAELKPVTLAPIRPPAPTASKPVPPAPATSKPLPEIEEWEPERVPGKPISIQIREVAQACWSSVVKTYRTLPDWATPIVWGLGIAAPIISLMILWRTVTR